MSTLERIRELDRTEELNYRARCSMLAEGVAILMVLANVVVWLAAFGGK